MRALPRGSYRAPERIRIGTLNCTSGFGVCGSATKPAKASEATWPFWPLCCGIKLALWGRVAQNEGSNIEAIEVPIRKIERAIKNAAIETLRQKALGWLSRLCIRFFAAH